MKNSSTSFKPSKAYDKFESVIKRSLNMLTKQEFLEKILSQVPEQDRDCSDISRAAIVLAVSAMDSYFTNVFIECLVQYIKKHEAKEKLVNLLKDAGVGTKCALELLTLQRPYRRIRSLVEKHLARQVMQKPESVNKLFEAYGFSDFCNNIQDATGKKSLMETIKKIVFRRHKIVHEGDMNAHGRIVTINAKTVKKHILAILSFVSKSDELIIKKTR